MMSKDQIIALYELLHGTDYTPATAPTVKSISAINKALGISLPASFIAFAKACRSYGADFASIGEDYSNAEHIIALNKWCKELTEAENEDFGLPSWAIIINHGHDQDCICLDTRNFDSSTGEYEIVYWDADSGLSYVPTLGPFKTFWSYMEWLVLKRAEKQFDNLKRGGQKYEKAREKAREKIPRIEAILNGKWR